MGWAVWKYVNLPSWSLRRRLGSLTHVCKLNKEQTLLIKTAKLAWLNSWLDGSKKKQGIYFQGLNTVINEQPEISKCSSLNTLLQTKKKHAWLVFITTSDVSPNRHIRGKASSALSLTFTEQHLVFYYWTSKLYSRTVFHWPAGHRPSQQTTPIVNDAQAPSAGGLVLVTL